MERKIQPIKSKQTNLLYGLGVLKGVGFTGNRTVLQEHL